MEISGILLNGMIHGKLAILTLLLQMIHGDLLMFLMAAQMLNAYLVIRQYVPQDQIIRLILGIEQT